MAVLQIFVSQQLVLFLFSKHLDTMSNVRDCGTGQTDLCTQYYMFTLKKGAQHQIYINNLDI